MQYTWIRKFFGLYAPSSRVSLPFREVQTSMGAYQTLGRMLFNLRLLSGALPGSKYHTWDRSRVFVRHLTEEEKLVAALVHGAWALGEDNRVDFFTMFPPTPYDPVEGVILVPYGPVRFEQPVQAGQEAEAVKLLKQRMRGELDYRCDFHGLFRTKPIVEGDSNDDVPKSKSAPRLPRKKRDKPRTSKRQSRTKSK